ncbi:MAG: hypothetical protein IJ333_03555 [Clostridia bacterium]|nr:hypothetical protein [Clostridia bacterium]
MKRIFAFLLILTLIVSLSGCKGGEDSSGEVAYTDEVVDNIELDSEQDQTATEQNKPQTSKPAEQKPSKTPDPSAQEKDEPQKEQDQPQKLPQASQDTEKGETAPQYQNLTCRSSSDIRWQTVRINHASTNIKLQIDLPSDWTLNKQSNGAYQILRSGKNIGTITTAAMPNPKEILEFSSRKDQDYGIYVYQQVNWYQENGTDTVSRSFEFACNQRNDSITIYLQLDYTELDNKAATFIFDSAVTIPTNVPFVPLSQTNGSKKILILGNSFINSSKIGTFLNDMLKTSGSGYSVQAVSIGYANVEDYAENASICEAIRRGEYCYVFQCGFYSSENNVTAFGKMKEICEASNTQIVIFPAHNENRSTIQSAKDTHYDSMFLDWRTEINNLIASGISQWDFCKNDSYMHSTPLAGYVGAHMIYRSLFNEVPPALSANAPLSMDYVRSKLGNYVTTLGKEEFTGKEIVIA